MELLIAFTGPCPKAPGRRWAAERRGLAPGPRAWLPLAGCWLASYAVSTTGMAPLAGALTCTGSWAGELAADTGVGRQQQWADDLGHGDRAGQRRRFCRHRPADLVTALGRHLQHIRRVSGQGV